VPLPHATAPADSSRTNAANAAVCRSFALVHIGRNGAGEGEKPLADPQVVPSMSDVRASLRFELAGAGYPLRTARSHSVSRRRLGAQ
jgi:hypothetical protein